MESRLYTCIMQALPEDSHTPVTNQPSQSQFLKRFGPWALVTGASSGIGEAFAMGLAERGIHVILHGRREDALQAIAHKINLQKGGVRS